MQSCSVHHCVLFLLTLTFTTDPASACVFPIYTKLHQPVTLPCEARCGGVAMWNLINNRDVVFARCDNTSCRSLKDGYEMSHTRYLRGDFSLTITKPDYSMRETYTCECGDSDYVTVRLRISTVFSAVQMSPGEDLKLDLSVPEPVEVIYRGSVSAAGEQICNVTNSSLQCKDEYTPRTSLSYPELTLRGLGRSETGTYTIRNLDYKEEIRVYAVSVSGLTTGETAGIVIGVVLLLLAVLIPGVMMYQKRREVRRLKEEVDDLIQQAVSKPPGEEKEKLLQQVEEKIEALKKKYEGDSEHSDSIRDFCKIKRDKLVMRLKEEVDKLFKEVESKPPGEEKKKLQQQMKEMIEALWQKYRYDREYKGDIRFFCCTYREELVKKQKEEVDDLFREAESKPPGEERMKLQQQMMEKIEALEKYRDNSEYTPYITNFCCTYRAELMKSLKEEVDELILKANYKRPGEKEELLQQVEKKIDTLEETYRDKSGNSGNSRIMIFCRKKRIELNLIKQGEFVNFGRMFMTRTEMVMTILQELEGEATKRSISDQQLSEKCESVDSNLKMIEIRCSDQREKMMKFVKEIKKQPLSGDVTNTKMMHNKETCVIEVKEEDKKPAGETDPLLLQV